MDCVDSTLVSRWVKNTTEMPDIIKPVSRSWQQWFLWRHHALRLTGEPRQWWGVLWSIKFISGIQVQINLLTEAISPSPVGFLVTTSHFSGVVTIICVLAISAFVNCISRKWIRIRKFPENWAYRSTRVLLLRAIEDVFQVFWQFLLPVPSLVHYKN